MWACLLRSSVLAELSVSWREVNAGPFRGEPKPITGSLLKAWNRSEYSLACFPDCQEFCLLFAFWPQLISSPLPLPTWADVSHNSESDVCSWYDKCLLTWRIEFHHDIMTVPIGSISTVRTTLAERLHPQPHLHYLPWNNTTRQAKQQAQNDRFMLLVWGRRYEQRIKFKSG